MNVMMRVADFLSGFGLESDLSGSLTLMGFYMTHKSAIDTIKSVFSGGIDPKTVPSARACLQKLIPEGKDSITFLRIVRRKD